MRVLFISNFYNHHQAALSQELYKRANGEYRFVSTEMMPEDRKKLGYRQIEDDFVVYYGENPRLVQEWIDEADAVIMGSAPERLLKNRRKQRKLILRYSERPLKNGNQWWKYPARWIRWHKNNPRRGPIYMLCASAYTASDYAKFGLFKKRALKWGYFPCCKTYENVEEMIAQKDKRELLWCGRFLDWKHPDDALRVAARLKQENVPFHLTMIGTGQMEEQLKAMTKTYGLMEHVTFTGSMSPEQVRTAMERAGIYLMTSDRKEGWGAVVNEAMNSGCALVASREAGSVPYLVQDGCNGLQYKAGCIDDLYEKVHLLLEHPEEQQRMGVVAYESLVTMWNAETAASRLVEIIAQLQEGTMKPFLDGPCSEA